MSVYPETEAANIRPSLLKAFDNSLTNLENPCLSPALPDLQFDCQQTGYCHSNDKPSNPRVFNILVTFATKFLLLDASRTNLEYLSPDESVQPPMDKMTLTSGF